MIIANVIEVVFSSEDCDPETARSLLMDCEARGRCLRRPQSEAVALMFRRQAHAIIANRLTLARNRSRLNNDKINRLMHNKYLERGRIGKGWTFTNALNKRNAVLLDDEEVEMLSTILAIPEEEIALHLKVLPWALKDQKEKQEKRKKKRSAAKTPARASERIILDKKDTKTTGSSISDAEETITQRNEITYTPELIKETEVHDRHPKRVAARHVPLQGGDVKISHSNGVIRVTGKIWSDLATAQKLRMIVPLKLIQQAKHDDPWCYEINSKVFAYQLYSLMHVLYGTPRVLQVEESQVSAARR